MKEGEKVSRTDIIIKAVKQDPRFQRGLSLLKEHDYEAAVSIFEDLLKTKYEKLLLLLLN